jgi:hypothetical protein
MAGESSSSLVGTSTWAAIEPRWNWPGGGGLVSIWMLVERRIRPPRWPRSNTGSGGAALPRAVWNSATSSVVAVVAVWSSTPRPTTTVCALGSRTTATVRPGSSWLTIGRRTRLSASV